jgi:putative DNA primase/helicase
VTIPDRQAEVDALFDELWPAKGTRPTPAKKSCKGFGKWFTDAVAKLQAAPHGKRSELIFALLAECHRRRVDRDEVWSQVYNVSKFAEHDRKWFDGECDRVGAKVEVERQHAKDIDPGDEARDFLAAVPPLRLWRGSFFQFDGSCYRELSDADVRASLIRHLDKRYHSLGSRIVSNVLDHVKAYAGLDSRIEPPAWIDGDGWPAHETLAMKTMLLHLPTRETIPSTPRYFSTAALSFDYMKDWPTPKRWEQLIEQEIWPDDPESVATLQEVMLYLLLGDTRLQKIFALIGPKRAGKGVIGRIIRALIGPSNCAGPTLASFAQNFGMAMLLHKLVAMISDARLNGHLNKTAIVERMLAISGEDALSIDRKFQSPICAKLPTRLVLLSNELPHLPDASGALASRFLVLRLNRSFYGKEQHDLTEQLIDELPGILNWVLEAWDRFHARGRFVQPASGRELLDQLTDLASPIGSFVEECCIIDSDKSVKLADLFVVWCRWCDAAGREHGTDAGFSKDLTAAYSNLRRSRPRDGDSRPVTLYGIGLASGTGGTG